MDMMSIRRRIIMQNIGAQNQNLLNGIESGAYNATGGDSSSSIRLRSIGFINVDGNTQYKFDASTTLTKNVQCIISQFAQIGNTYIAQSVWSDVPYTFTTNANAKYLRCMIRYSDNTNIYANDVTAELVKV